jgi:DNA-binding response OmpR family regulator
MALNALNTLVAQHGFAKLEEAFQLLKEQEEVKARFAAALSKEQGEEVFKALLEAEVPATVEPAKATPRRRSTQNSYQLASEETIEQIIKSIDDGNLRSQTKSVSWKAKHYPSSAKPLEILNFLRDQASRSATKEQLLQGLSHWSWTNATGNPYTLSDYMRELLKQGIVISI